MNSNAFRTVSYMEVDPMRPAFVLLAIVTLLFGPTRAVRGDFFHTAPIPFDVQVELTGPSGQRNYTKVPADPPGTGYVELVPPIGTQHFVGSGTIVIPMITHSTASASSPDRFNRFSDLFSVNLKVTDDSLPGPVAGRTTDAPSGYGFLYGTFSAHASNLYVVPQSPQPGFIGNHAFGLVFPQEESEVKFRLGAPGTGPTDLLVNVSASVIPPPVPEPSTLAIAVLGLACCAMFAWRISRRHPFSPETRPLRQLALPPTHP